MKTYTSFFSWEVEKLDSLLRNWSKMSQISTVITCGENYSCSSHRWSWFLMEIAFQSKWYFSDGKLTFFWGDGGGSSVQIYFLPYGTIEIQVATVKIWIESSYGE